MPSAARRAGRTLLQALAGLVGFALGGFMTWVLLMRLMAPASGCDAPCDGPAYLAMALSILASPVIGIFTGIAACLLVTHLMGGHTSR